MVELFTVGCLVRSPRLSAPVWSVARRTAPHVSTVERTRHDSKPMSPRDGIRQSIATPALFRTAQSPRRRFRHRNTEHVRLARIQNVKNKSRHASSKCNVARVSDASLPARLLWPVFRPSQPPHKHPSCHGVTGHIGLRISHRPEL